MTLTGTPAKIAASMAGSPSVVPGILMKRLGLPPRWWRSRAAASVRLRVVGEKRRDLERHPAVDAVGPGEDGLEQIGGPGQIRQAPVRRTGPRADFARRRLAEQCRCRRSALFLIA